jgi:cytochrome b6-f complex iron-sulfur subunit
MDELYPPFNIVRGAMRSMATATTTDAKARASIAKAEAAQEAQQPAIMVDAPTRREFLYYIWGASIALLLGQVTAGLVWFTFPRFREGEFGGVFALNSDILPPMSEQPTSVPSGRFHVSNTENGVLALYGVCTHLGCLPKWATTTARFECPCHGSKFEGDGSYIEGPAPRGLDRFPVTIVYNDGTEVASDGTGAPVPLDPNKTIAQIRVDTGSRINGPSA